jgi:translation initiation factor 5B
MADVDFEFEDSTAAAPALILGKKKKKKKPSAAKPAADDHALDSVAGALHGISIEAPGADVDAGASLGLRKKKKKKMKTGDVDDKNAAMDDEPVENEAPRPSPISAFGLLDGDGDSDNDAVDDVEGGDEPVYEVNDAPKAEEEVRVPRAKKGKKKPAPNPPADEDLDALLAEFDDTKSAPTAAAAAAAKPADDDLDAILAELDGPSAEAAPAAKKGKKKMKPAASTTANDDDLDALLAELDALKPTAAFLVAPDARDEHGGNDGLDAMMAEMDDDGDETVAAAPKLTAAQKKKAKAKAKKAAAADTPGDDLLVAPAAAAADEPASGGGTKKGKKESTAVRRLREQRERVVAEEKRLAKMRDEEERVREEEERQEEERQQAIAAQKRAKKEAEKAKKARLKAEGKLLSKAEAARKRKADAFRAQAMASGMVFASAGGGIQAATAGSNEVTPPSVAGPVVYASKKKKLKAKTDNSNAAMKEPAQELPAETPSDDKALNVDETPSTPVPETIVPDEWDAEVSEPDDATLNTPDMATSAKAANRVDQGEVGTVDVDSDVTKDSDDDEDDSESDTESDETDESEDEYAGMSKAEIAAEKRRDSLRKTRLQEAAAAKAARTPDYLRSPIICILGHVDTGKTKILDKIRRTNVQDGEAGGITQQIGATYFPMAAVKKETTKLAEGRALEYNVPSLLIIDTPGHESFTNLRSRGSSLCDIAILVVDIMHGLEPQTRESIDLLKLRKTPFIVALNKIDRLYDWDAQNGNCPTRDSMARQRSHVLEEFKQRTKAVQLEFAEIGFNTSLYWENDDVRRTISIVPTSAITGEGMPDLLMLLLSLSQKLLTERLMFSPILEATVLEVKVIEGLGTTIDIVLTGGTIRQGDTIMVVGLDGPIQTSIRALLTPHPMKEMRVKGAYVHHKEIIAAQGIKISADGLDKAVAGTQLMVVRNPSDEDEIAVIKDEVMKDFATILQNIDKSGLGVYVQASTLGSLEALLEFLRTSEIPVAGINIGPVHKKDVNKASIMVDKRKEFATILAFDVPVEREAREMAEDVGVTIFTRDIIYHLFDDFTEHMEKAKTERREMLSDDVVFPCIVKIRPSDVFNKKDPIVVGVDVLEGILRVGTPLVVLQGNTWVDIGRAVSIELNMKSVKIATRGESVALKIQSNKTAHIAYGRHFDWQNQLVSKMSRTAIDILKEDFRDDLTKDDWRLVVKLKTMMGII